MRFTPVSLAIATSLALVSSSVSGQKPDAQLDPRSQALVAKAEALVAAGSLSAAEDAVETGLAVDPRNRQGFVVLGRIARQQGLPGKAIRAYKSALLLDPNDQIAIAGEGEAMVQKGAVESARENLAQLAKLCKTGCPAQGELAAAIAKGPPPAVMTAQATTTVPAKGDEAKTVKPE